MYRYHPYERPRFSCFGAQPAFGGTSTPAFGGTSTPAFGSNSSPFGVASTGFGAASTPACGNSSAPSYGFDRFASILAFGQSASALGVASTPVFGNNPSSGSTPSLFGAQRSAFGSFSDFRQTQLAFRSQPFGATSQSAVASTGFGTASTPACGNSSAPSYGFTRFASIPAFGQSASALGAASTPVFGNNPSSGSTPSLFGAQRSAFGPFSDFHQTQPAFHSQPFGATSQSAVASTGFGAASIPACGNSSAPSYGCGSIPAFGQSASALGAASTPVFGNNPSSGSTPSPFGAQRSAFVASIVCGAASTPACGDSSAPSYGFGSIPAFGQSASAFGAASTPVFGNNPSSGSTPSLFGAQRSAFGPFSDFHHTQPAFHKTQPAFHSQPFGATSQSAVASTGFGAASTLACGQTTFGQPAEQNMMVTVPLPVSNPFGTLPPMPQMFIGWSAGSAPSIQYGISSLPVIKKPTKVRTTSLLAPRHITPKSRICMHSRGYKPKKNGSKVVSFFSDGEEALCTPRADAIFFLPRENPRALFIRQPDQSSPSVVLKPAVNMKEMAVPINDHDAKENCPGDLVKSSSRQNGSSEEHSHRGNGYISFSGHSASEVAIVYKHGEDIEALMPKLRNSDYYTEPTIQELAAKERALPGYCSRVKDFVIGRKGYGCVKFFGETDVRQLDLDSIIQFKESELSVYNKKSKRPFPGQGLDKPAEITLLNVQCVDKKTGRHCTEGVKVDKLEKRLKRKTEQEGAEFMSYNAIKGEWKFCVKYFSKKIRLGGVEDANIQSNLLSSKLVAASIELSSRQNGSREEHGADIEALMPKLRHSDY